MENSKLNKKIGLFLMTEKGYISLLELVKTNNKENIAFVCIGKDKNVINDFNKEILDLCRENNIVYFYRENFNFEFAQKALYNIAISWKWIIKISNLITFHDSLLPKYRGFAPIVNSLINGEKKVGVTVLYATNEYDKGDIILQKSINIDYPIKIGTVIKRISKIYAELIINFFELIKTKKKIIGKPQNENEATYSLWLDEKDYFINWHDSSDRIKRKIDACGFPYLNAKAIIDNQVIEIIDASLVDDIIIENRQPGKVIFFDNVFPIIVCGTGLLKITNAFYSENKNSIFPLKKFRIRLL